MKVFVTCGDRKFDDVNHVVKALESYDGDIEEIAFITNKGGAGSDPVNEQARAWAESKGIQTTPFIIDWNNIKVPGAVVAQNSYGKYNKNAAIYTKEQMMDYCDVMIAIDDCFETKKFDEMGKEVILYSVDANKTDDDYEYHFWRK